MRRRLTASVALIALAAAALTAMGAKSAVMGGNEVTRSASARQALTYYGGEISRFQREARRWERLMSVPRTPRATRSLAQLGPSAVKQAAAAWRHKAAALHARALHPPHLRQFLCIHRYEGSWTDTGPPYYGGLQMDLGFQRTYGGWLYAAKGTADHWSPLEQIWTAEKALKSRGFWPWPNTARYCGLI